jgi:hypothetical protein
MDLKYQVNGKLEAWRLIKFPAGEVWNEGRAILWKKEYP